MLPDQGIISLLLVLLEYFSLTSLNGRIPLCLQHHDYKQLCLSADGN